MEFLAILFFVLNIAAAIYNFVEGTPMNIVIGIFNTFVAAILAQSVGAILR